VAASRLTEWPFCDLHTTSAIGVEAGRPPPSRTSVEDGGTAGDPVATGGPSISFPVAGLWRDATQASLPGTGGTDQDTRKWLTSWEGKDDVLGIKGPPYRQLGVDAKWEHCIVVADANGNNIETWTQWDKLLRRPHSVYISPYDPEKHVWVVDDNMQVIVVSTFACPMTAFFIKGLYSMTQLARALEQVMGAPVVDRSSMPGVFDIDLQWGTGKNIEPGQALSTIGVDEQSALLTALREQIGLKLDTTRAPYEVIVVDAVSRPTPN
jgi:Protein of unknown function (DUF3738)